MHSYVYTTEIYINLQYIFRKCSPHVPAMKIIHMMPSLSNNFRFLLYIVGYTIALLTVIISDKVRYLLLKLSIKVSFEKS